MLFRKVFGVNSRNLQSSRRKLNEELSRKNAKNIFQENEELKIQRGVRKWISEKKTVEVCS